jgi:hypothetical protein
MSIECWAQNLMHLPLRELATCTIATCSVQLAIDRETMHKVTNDVNVWELSGVHDARHVGEVIRAHYVPYRRLESRDDPLIERSQGLLTLLEQCQPCLSPSDGGLTLVSDELDHAQKIFGKMLVLVIGRVRQSHGILHESKLASISTTMPPQ